MNHETWSGHPSRSVWRAVTCGVVLLATARRASGDATPSLALDPAPAGDRGFVLERAAVRSDWTFSARIAGDYASDPLVLKNGSQSLDRVVSQQTWLYALASYSLAHRFAFHLTLPVVVLERTGAVPSGGATAPRPEQRAALGDILVGARAKVYGSHEDAAVRTEMAISTSAWIPTASDGYAGDGAARVRAGLVLEGESRRLYWVMSGGLRTRPSETLPGLVPTRVGTAVTVGLGGGFFADGARRLALGTEIASDLTVGAGARLFDPRATTTHVLLTGHWRVGGGPIEVGAAFGPGIGQGAGSAGYRLLFLVGFAAEQAAPLADEDRDGVPNRSDACPSLPGVPSPDPLLNGCPAAPADTDGDAIPDDYDACPKAPGEPTGERTTHGCPRPVGPKPPTQLVERQIVLSQQVEFEFGKAILRPESDVVLGEVLRVLEKHGELELVEVQGHTDEQGAPDLNRHLGEARAASVVAWLVEHGVKRSRLLPKGYGADRPLAGNSTDEGRQKNRRVEFHVLRSKPAAPSPNSPDGSGNK